MRVTIFFGSIIRKNLLEFVNFGKHPLLLSGYTKEPSRAYDAQFA